jgi:hypothetical protein
MIVMFFLKNIGILFCFLYLLFGVLDNREEMVKRISKVNMSERDTEEMIRALFKASKRVHGLSSTNTELMTNFL